MVCEQLYLQEIHIHFNYSVCSASKNVNTFYQHSYNTHLTKMQCGVAGMSKLHICIARMQFLHTTYSVILSFQIVLFSVKFKLVTNFVPPFSRGPVGFQQISYIKIRYLTNQYVSDALCFHGCRASNYISSFLIYLCSDVNLDLLIQLFLTNKAIHIVHLDN